MLDDLPFAQSDLESLVAVIGALHSSPGRKVQGLRYLANASRKNTHSMLIKRGAETHRHSTSTHEKYSLSRLVGTMFPFRTELKFRNFRIFAFEQRDQTRGIKTLLITLFRRIFLCGIDVHALLNNHNAINDN